MENQNGMNNEAKNDANNGAKSEGAEKKARRRLVSNILLGVSILLFAAGIYLLLREYVIMPNTGYEAPPTMPPATAAPVLTATPQAEATPAPTPAPTPYTLRPAKLYFPTFEQVCEIQPVGLTEDGAMDTVPSNVIAAWYEYGPAPGDKGNALINGHKSWKGEKGVFSQLKEMTPGDSVVVEMDDGSYTYWSVDQVAVYDRTGVPASAMELRWGEAPQITLISCTGSWDALAGTSSQRVVVVCRQTSGASAPEAQ